MSNTNPDVSQLDLLFSKISEGFAYCKIITDGQGKPIDWLYLDVNAAYERINDVKKDSVIGKKATEVLPSIKSDPADWINLYGRVALTGEPVTTERYAAVRNKWYHISAHSPAKGYFISIFEDITARKKAEQEIAEAKQRLEAHINNAPEAVIEFDPQFRVIRWSNEASRMFGWSAEEIIGKSIAEMPWVFKDDIAIVQQVSDDMLTGKRPRNVSQNRNYRKDGSIINCEWYNSAIYDESGKLLSILSQIIDITERTKAEKALQQSEERFSKAFNASPIAVIITRLSDGCYIDVNETFLEIFGYTREDIIGHTSTEINVFADPGGRKAFLALLSKEGGRLRNREMTFRSKKDKLVPSIISVEKLVLNGEDHLITTLVDITERKAAEEEVIKAKEDWERTFDAVPDLIAILDTDHRIIRLNKAMASQLRVAPQEAIGLICYECVHGTNAPIENCPHAQLLNDGQQHIAEVHEPLLGGDFIVSATPLRDQNGKLIGSIHVARDITKRKQTEEALRESEQRWSTTLSSIGDAVIATDTNGKITFMNPVAEALTGWTLEEAKQKPVTKVFQIINAQTREEVESPVTKVLEKGLVVGLANHTLLICKDKTEVPIDDSGAPITGEDGKISGVVLVFRDITERKKAEQAVVESEERLKRSQEIAHLGSWELDLKEDKLVWSDEVYRIFGLKPQEFGATYEAFLAAVHPEDRAAVDKAYSDSVRKGKDGYEIEHRVVRKDSGEIRVVHEKCTHIRDRSGRIIKSLGMIQDVTERKKAEEKIALQAFMIENANDAIIGYGTDRRITFWNKAAEKLYGYTAEEALGKVGFDLFRTLFVNINQNEMFQQLAIHGHVETESKRLTKDGEVRSIEAHAILLRDENSKPIGYLVVDRDVTERKRAEEALKRQAALIDLSPDAIIVRKIDGTITFWSKGAEKLYGWTKEEAVGKSTHELLGTKFSKQFSAIVAELQSKRSWSGEVTQKTKAGKEVVMQSWWLAERTEHGEIKSILESNVDLTERKNAEKEIARLASFPTLNPSPVVEVTVDGKVTYANPATKALFPTLESEGLNDIFFSYWEEVKKAFEDKNSNTFGREIKINGHWYHQQFYLVPQTQQIRIYTTDIDELKQTEEARAQAQKKLEENAVMLEEYASQMEELAEQRAQQLQNAERMVAIGQTAGMVGHDIRNPLQAITSDMYLISEEVKSMQDDECKQAILESIESVNQNLGYINKIVSDLQDYTRPLKPNVQAANLAELIEGTLLTINVPKGIEVATDIKDTAKPITTDIAYMRRILTNLMTNAIQAMEEEGKLTVQATKKEGIIIIAVQDTGTGIPAEIKPKLFTPLFTTKSKGQGLGLAVVKRLVEALKGTITFESTEGQGTKFTVEFPQEK